MSGIDMNRERKKYSYALGKSNHYTYKTIKKMAKQRSKPSFTESTASMTDINKNLTQTKFTCSNKLNNIEPKKSKTKERHLSYVEFLEFRKNIMNPLGYREKRFKWQEPNGQGDILSLPRRKKNYRVQECHFKNGFKGWNEGKIEIKTLKKRIRRSFSITGRNNFNFNDLSVTRRVIEPEFNEECLIKPMKKSSSLKYHIFHRTNGNVKSLFNLTPIFIPLKCKKLYKGKSLPSKSINIFEENENKYEDIHYIKKHFLNNKCYFDNIQNEGLIEKKNFRVFDKYYNSKENPMNEIQFLKQNIKIKKSQKCLSKIKRRKKRSLS